MLKIGDKVNVCFDGVIRSMEQRDNGDIVYRVECRSPQDIFCLASVSEEFIGTKLTKGE